MSTFSEQYVLGNNPNFINIVKIAILKGASIVAGEEQPNKSEEFKLKRQALANLVMSNVGNQARAFALHLASTDQMNCTIDTSTGALIYTSDEASLNTLILSRLEDIWNDRAGITFEEAQDINPE